MSPHSPELLADLAARARQIRCDIVRMTCAAASGHPGGALSAADLVAALYFHHLTLRPDEPHWPDRDRFLLSKGHACPVWYAALARRGYFDPSHLDTLRRFHSILQGHPDMKKTPGVDMTSGSLGQGLSVGAGMALAGRRLAKDFRVVVLMGDGEMQEGQVWEAAMTAAHYRLGRLTAIVDVNGLQVDGPVADIMEVQPLADKWRAFNWAVREIDGHDLGQILDALAWTDGDPAQPCVILARTVKGKGVSYMENVVDWHGNAPTAAQMEQAVAELCGTACACGEDA